MHVLAISGSLQENSANTALLRAISVHEGELDVVVWDELGALPLFRPGDDGDVHVESLRHGIGEADAVLIATPEYAGGMPGALKNALDWLVGSGELYEKPVLIMSAAPSPERGQNARRWVAEVVAMQGGVVLDSFTVAVNRADGAPNMSELGETALRRVRAALGDS